MNGLNHLGGKQESLIFTWVRESFLQYVPCLPFHNLYPASGCVGDSVMVNRANELTEPAAGALFWTNSENFTHGVH